MAKAATISDFQLPSDPIERKKIMSALEDISAQLQMVKDRNASISETKAMLLREFEMPRSLTGQLVSSIDDGDYQGEVSDHNTFEFVRESLFGAGTAESDS